MPHPNDSSETVILRVKSDDDDDNSGDSDDNGDSSNSNRRQSVDATLNHDNGEKVAEDEDDDRTAPGSPKSSSSCSSPETTPMLGFPEKQGFHSTRIGTPKRSSHPKHLPGSSRKTCNPLRTFLSNPTHSSPGILYISIVAASLLSILSILAVLSTATPLQEWRQTIIQHKLMWWDSWLLGRISEQELKTLPPMCLNYKLNAIHNEKRLIFPLANETSYTPDPQPRGTSSASGHANLNLLPPPQIFADVPKDIFFLHYNPTFTTYRYLCSVESAAKKNQDHAITILAKNVSDLDHKLTHWRSLVGSQIADRITVMPMRYAHHFADTPLQQWWESGAWKQSTWVGQNLGNALRLAVVWKYGGVYMDLDIISINPLRGMGRSIAREEINRVNNAALRFPREDPLVWALMEEFVEGWNGYMWAYNGPWAMTRMFFKRCQKTCLKLGMIPAETQEEMAKKGEEKKDEKKDESKDKEGNKDEKKADDTEKKEEKKKEETEEKDASKKDDARPHEDAKSQETGEKTEDAKTEHGDGKEVQPLSASDGGTQKDGERHEDDTVPLAASEKKDDDGKKDEGDDKKADDGGEKDKAAEPKEGGSPNNNNTEEKDKASRHPRHLTEVDPDYADPHTPQPPSSPYPQEHPHPTRRSPDTPATLPFGMSHSDYTPAHSAQLQDAPFCQNLNIVAPSRFYPIHFGTRAILIEPWTEHCDKIQKLEMESVGLHWWHNLVNDGVVLGRESFLGSVFGMACPAVVEAFGLKALEIV
ncbi:uncharacterized protein EV422DRAFT_538113 [Fimicolochytrium jonesii]|uniref:uncharacterized protein n=1 Tax=Fimicolochytrium jonesii TaxID=1396493 RepID=UPI0022FE3D71|nr:uncharacterized protein EV422DRAFT_538113 [Fimicolochytrium jonesii]KAI8818317.1 hypothetical protein EV422DRAFT_538113 [Fimicolochytrium jonesii]